MTNFNNSGPLILNPLAQDTGRLTKADLSAPLTGSHIGVSADTEEWTTPKMGATSTKDELFKSEERQQKRDRLRAKDSAPTRPPPYYIDGLEKWECEITNVYLTTFSATLVRLNGDDSELLEAEFAKRLVPKDDQDLVRIGAIFYLTVRTVLNGRGDPRHTSGIAFRRFGRWTSSDLSDIEADITALSLRIADAF